MSFGFTHAVKLLDSVDVMPYLFYGQLPNPSSSTRSVACKTISESVASQLFP